MFGGITETNSKKKKILENIRKLSLNQPQKEFPKESKAEFDKESCQKILD